MMVRRIDSQKLIRNIVACALFVLFIGYGFYSARKLIEGPEIYISSPTITEASTLEADELLQLEGSTKNIQSLTANGRLVYIDEKGNWNERLMLPPGYTIITLVGTDRFGHKTTERIDVLKKIPPLTSSDNLSTSITTNVDTESSSVEDGSSADSNEDSIGNVEG